MISPLKLGLKILLPLIIRLSGIIFMGIIPLVNILTYLFLLCKNKIDSLINFHFVGSPPIKAKLLYCIPKKFEMSTNFVHDK
jgi:hypothetical protein